MARGKLRVIKVPGDAGISRASLVSVLRANRETMRELHAVADAAGERGFWTPKHVHDAMCAVGPKFRRLVVDIKSRGVCAALIHQLGSPLVRVRRLDVRRAPRSGFEEKEKLFAAVARLRSETACELKRIASAPSLLDLAAFGKESEEAEAEVDALRRLTLASCGLTAGDARERSRRAIDERVDPWGGERDHRDATPSSSSFAPAMDLDLADNHGIGCDGVRALAPLVASGAVRALDLENCGVGEAGAVALGAALASPSCALTHLCVSRNFIGAVGMDAIAVGLRRGPGGDARAARVAQRVRRRGGATSFAAAIRHSSGGAFEMLEVLDVGRERHRRGRRRRARAGALFTTMARARSQRCASCGWKGTRSAPAARRLSRRRRRRRRRATRA